MKTCLLMLLCALVPAPLARAQVAVATAIADGDVRQRDLAALVVAPASQAWQMLRPQLETSAVKSCSPGDTACLQALARERGASHVLIIAVVPSGVRDHLVAVQLFSVDKPDPSFEDSARQSGAESSSADVRALAARLLETAGPPPPVPTAAADPATAPPAATSAASPLGVGAPVLLAGAAVVGVSFAAAFPLAASQEPTTGYAVSVVGGALGSIIAVVGAGLIVAEAL